MQDAPTICSTGTERQLEVKPTLPEEWEGQGEASDTGRTECPQRHLHTCSKGECAGLGVLKTQQGERTGRRPRKRLSAPLHSGAGTGSPGHSPDCGSGGREGKGRENAENLECDVETAYHKEHGLS